MLRNKRRWPVIVGLIAAFFIVGLGITTIMLSQTTQGSVELPSELPSPEIMAHITANLDQLCAPNGPFTRANGMGVVTVLDYANDSGLSIMVTLESDAAPGDVLAAAPSWQGKYVGYSDLLARLFDSGAYLLSFVCTQGPLVLFVTQEDAAAISTAPLTEALSIIQSVIGTP